MPVEVAVTPTRRQWDFITCPADIILFGGARGGAKTIGSLLDFWYHAIEHGEDARGLMVRKQRTDLRDTHPDRDPALRLGRRVEGAWLLLPVPQRRPAVVRLSGARDRCRGLSGLVADPRLHRGGRPVHLAGADLAADGDTRSSAGVKCQMRLTCNPGGPSHFALKSFFVDNGPDASSAIPRPA